MKINISIVDADSVYRERFYRQWNKRFAAEAPLQWFDSFRSFQDAHPAGCDVLVMDPAQCSREQQNALDSSFRGMLLFWGNETGQVPKYRTVEQIYRRILFLLSEEESMQLARRDLPESRGRVRLFTGRSGRLGTSSLSLACARALASQHADKRVFHLSMDFFASTSPIGPKAAGLLTLSDVILGLRLPFSNMILRMEACTQVEQRVRFFPKPLVSADCLEIKGEEWNSLITLLKQTEDEVLIDCPRDLLVQHPDLLSVADYICLLSKGNEEEMAKEWIHTFGGEWTQNDLEVVRMYRPPHHLHALYFPWETDRPENGQIAERKGEDRLPSWDKLWESTEENHQWMQWIRQ